MGWYELVKPHEIDQELPHGWIQWKGSDACVDLRCRCGHLGHYDGWSLYFYKCPACSETFCVGQVIRLYPIEKDRGEEIAKDNAKTSYLDGDSGAEFGRGCC